MYMYMFVCHMSIPKNAIVVIHYGPLKQISYIMFIPMAANNKVRHQAT